ncbi:MAG: hypothetical protein V8S69_05270 [Dakarella massiliensis]
MARESPFRQCFRKRPHRAASGRRPAEIRGELSHLYIPEEGGTRFRRYIATTPAEQLPSMDLRIRDLQLEDMKLGSIAIMANSCCHLGRRPCLDTEEPLRG